MCLVMYVCLIQVKTFDSCLWQDYKSEQIEISHNNDNPEENNVPNDHNNNPMEGFAIDINYCLFFCSFFSKLACTYMFLKARTYKLTTCVTAF